LIVLDMDGVVTSERGYWDAAACTLVEFLADLGIGEAAASLQDALDNPKTARAWLPDPLIAEVKNRSINTNWDLTFLAVAWHLIDLLKQGEACHLRVLDQFTDNHFPPGCLRVFSDRGLKTRTTTQIAQEFIQACGEKMGYAAIAHLQDWAQALLGPSLPWLNRTGALWNKCFGHFQHWYLGTALAAQSGWAPAGAAPRKGIIFNEPLVIPSEPIRRTFLDLTSAGCTLAIGTGRCWAELEIPLKANGLVDFFDRARIATHDEIASAESELQTAGQAVSLSKPHPFCFLRAIYPQASNQALANLEPRFCSNAQVIVVGDTVGDIRAGRHIQATTVAVLTGVAGEKGRSKLVEAGAHYVIQDVSELAGLVQHLDPS